MRHGLIILSLACLGLAVTTACHKAAPIESSNPPAPPPVPQTQGKVDVPAPRPPLVAEFKAEPRAIELGQTALLRWTVKDASEVSITPEVGRVESTGTRRIFPMGPTRYTLRAKNPAGDIAAVASVSILDFPPLKQSSPEALSITQRLIADVPDVYFDYNSAVIREDAQVSLFHTFYVLRAIMADFPKAR